MNLFFSENISLSKTLYKIDISITVLYAAIAFNARTPLQALSTTAIIFGFLLVLSNSLLNYRDDRKVSALLDNFYGECNPSLFLSEIDDAIDLTIVKNKVKSLVLTHKANALCYNGLFNDAYKILDDVSAIATSEEDNALILANRISYKLLEEDFENMEEDILHLQKYINLNGSKSRKKSVLTNNSVVQKKLQLKIAKSEKLNPSEVNTLWEITNHGGNNLNLETLRYYSALFLVEEKDIKGASEQLSKINREPEKNIIEIKANELYRSIEHLIPVETEDDD
jgi:hypothetical protein